MCYTFRTSLISYIIGMASAVFAFCTRQLILGTLILAYAQMQLSEMMIWWGIDNNDLKWNKRGTTYGKYLLATHNIAIGLGFILSIIFISKRKVKPLDFIPLLVGILFFIYVVVFVYLPKKYPDVTYPYKQVCQKNCNDPENRLRWPFPHGWYLFSYIISFILLVLFIKPKSSKIMISIFFTLTFVVAGLIYPNTVGSVWCWSTSFMAPVVVLINYYLITNNVNSSDLFV